jgi:hypothetical protein
MKKLLPVVLIIVLIVTVNFSASAQCKSFAKKICKLELIPYIHDGNYHAAILSEGEEAELYKTFYEGQEYRIAICGSDALPPIEFKVIDANRNVLFNNKEHGMVKSWDFKLESSQQLKIVVKVPAATAGKTETDLVSGCVAIMFGFKS